MHSLRGRRFASWGGEGGGEHEGRSALGLRDGASAGFESACGFRILFRGTEISTASKSCTGEERIGDLAWEGSEGHLGEC